METKLETFPSEGYVKNVNQCIEDYLIKTFRVRIGHSKDLKYDIHTCWNDTQYWFTNVSSSKTPYNYDQIKHFVENLAAKEVAKSNKPVTIPEKWYIKVTEDNYSILGYWRTAALLDRCHIGGYILSDYQGARGYYVQNITLLPDYVEISTVFFNTFIDPIPTPESIDYVAMAKEKYPYGSRIITLRGSEIIISSDPWSYNPVYGQIRYGAWIVGQKEQFGTGCRWSKLISVDKPIDKEEQLVKYPSGNQEAACDVCKYKNNCDNAPCMKIHGRYCDAHGGQYYSGYKVLPQPIRKSFHVKYNNEFTEDLFNALMAWCKLETNFGPRAYNDTYKGLQQSKYFIFNNWGFHSTSYPKNDLEHIQAYGVDNNTQNCNTELSIDEVKVLIGYNSWNGEEEEDDSYNIDDHCEEVYPNDLETPNLLSEFLKDIKRKKQEEYFPKVEDTDFDNEIKVVKLNKNYFIKPIEI